MEIIDNKSFLPGHREGLHVSCAGWRRMTGHVSWPGKTRWQMPNSIDSSAPDLRHHSRITVEFIVPSTAGGSLDLTARSLKHLQQIPVIILSVKSSWSAEETLQS